MSDNSINFRKTGFGMASIARPRPVFCVFRPKIPRTFYFKLTEQSSRKKLAEGGFEPETCFDSARLHLKKFLFCLPRQKRFFLIFGAKTGQNTEKAVVRAVIRTVLATVFAFQGQNAGCFLGFFA